MVNKVFYRGESMELTRGGKVVARLIRDHRYKNSKYPCFTLSSLLAHSSPAACPDGVLQSRSPALAKASRKALLGNLTYPARLMRMLGSEYEVRNYGLCGRTLLKKGDFPYWKESFYRQSLSWEPDIVHPDAGGTTVMAALA